MSAANDTIPISIITGQQWTPLVVGGATYKQTPLSLSDLGQLEAWVKSQFPDPMETAKRMAEGLPLELAREVIATGQRQANNPRWCLGTDEAAAFLRTPLGMVELLSRQLKKYQPDLKRADIEGIVDTIMQDDQADLGEVSDQAQSVAVCRDRHAVDIEGIVDPKAETNPETTG